MFKPIGNLLVEKGDTISLATFMTGLSIDTIRVTDADIVLRQETDDNGDIVLKDEVPVMAKSDIRGVECTIKHTGIAGATIASILPIFEDFILDSSVTITFVNECKITYGVTI